MREAAARAVQRRDDDEAVVRARLHGYHESVESVAGVFLDAIRSVDANRSADAVFAEVCARINGEYVPPRVIVLGAPASGKGKHHLSYQTLTTTRGFSWLKLASGNRYRFNRQPGLGLTCCWAYF